MYAHLYFDKVIQQEAEFFEDYVEILIASPAVHFPALKKECERFICQEVMLVRLLLMLLIDSCVKPLVDNSLLYNIFVFYVD